MTICEEIKSTYEIIKETAAAFHLAEQSGGFHVRNRRAEALAAKAKLEMLLKKFATKETDITDETVFCLCSVSRQTAGKWKNFPAELREITGWIYFEDASFTDLGRLRKIGSQADFRRSKIENLGELRSIGRDVYFGKSKIVTLKHLQTIGGRASFFNSEVLDLGELKMIAGNADFEHSKLVSLGQLETIGGDAHFQNSNITDLGALKEVSGKIFIKRDSLLDFSKVKNNGIVYLRSGVAPFENGVF